MSGELYPEITPFDSGYLKVSDMHTIYWEQCGNPEGRPVVFLHGGPGGGLNNDYRRFFDPQHYRILLFDQRGCGKSTPHAELRENTTWDLVSDMEKLREKFGFKNWIVFGGSWGSTLALSYAVTHPEVTAGLILRGIFMCRSSELKWFYQSGAHEIFPDVWDKYRDHIPVAERGDFISAYYKRLTSTDAQTRLQAALIWSYWEAATSRLIPQSDAIAHYEDPEVALAFARIECHYFMNKAFFKIDDFLLSNAPHLAKIPGVIVQGRYDVVCPVRSAWDLHKAWPTSRLEIIKDAGHSIFEPGIRSALIAASDEFRKY